MSQYLIMIAIGVMAFLLGRLTARRRIRRLRAALADAVWWLRHDPLTGMLNRIGLYSAHLLADARGAQLRLILLIDLDDFKSVNDIHGHGIGDDLLIEIGDRISEAAETHAGTAARLSGDEFAVMLPVQHVYDPGRIADLFVTTISRPITLTVDGTPVTVAVTASIGVAIADTTDPLDDVALRRADTATYHAKDAGGNRYALYEPGMAMPTNALRRGPRLRDLRQQRRDVIA